MDLGRFGFTSTEARVYLALLRLSPATGYAVARAAGLARANTYGALETLAARGIVARLPGRPARFVAEDPEALVSRLGRQSQRDLEQLAHQLATVERRREGVHASAFALLADRDAVIDRCVACAENAREEILAVVGPWAAELFPALSGPARPHLVVKVLSLGSPAPSGAVVRAVHVSEIESYWGGLPIALVADRRVAVCAVATAGASTGVSSEHPALVPFVRHLLRRELALGAAQNPADMHTDREARRGS
ncbi:MAG TPA: helix-turn-helix domain-containing protein [Gemmatimonadales bacterium]|nr:helix-turn-helix domain-containing protein [Gemmatimonadales bacterium]